jgi:hypothetical protein
MYPAPVPQNGVWPDEEGQLAVVFINIYIIYNHVS